MTLEEQDVEAFTEAVKEYDSISRLDPWYEKKSSFNEKGGFKCGPHLGSPPYSSA